MDSGFWGIDVNNYDSFEDYIKNLNKFSYIERDANTPEVVAKICATLAKLVKAKRVLVSKFKYGVLTFGMQEQGFDVTSFIQNDFEKSIADKYTMQQYSKESSNYFEFACADMPLGIVHKTDFQEVIDIVAEALTESGYFACTFPTSVSWDKKYKDIIKYAEGNDLFVNAVIDMPKSSYAPMTHIDTKILIFQKCKNDKRFVARIAEITDVEVVVSNFVNKVAAKNYTIGSWVERGQYFDLQSFENELTNRKVAKNYGGTVMPIGDLATEINRPDRDNNFKDIPNSIFIPTVGTSAVVDSIEDFNIKPKNYMQVVLDENQISTQYACFFLNSEQGISNRRMMMNGFIPTFNLQTIRDLVIALPDGEGEQLEIMETHKQIEELKLQLEALESKFFKKPSDYKAIQRSLKDINNAETLSDWGETLPFPLASVLRRYLAENSYEKKQESLFLFFEAYAIYNACILLSVINENLDVFAGENVFETTDLKYYTRSSFGNWVTLNKIITNFVLGKLGGKKSEEEGDPSPLLGFFKTNNTDIIRVLCNKDINRILYSASVKRNNWKGHTGISSEDVCKEHVLELQKYLDQLRHIVKDSYEEMELIRATSCVNTRSGAENSIEKLTGSNALFMKDSYVTSTPLMTDVLYLRMKDTQRAIELLPLIVFKNSPSSEKNACYFYSKDEADNTLYVSYHYEQQPEETEPGHEALNSLKRIIPEKSQE